MLERVAALVLFVVALSVVRLIVPVLALLIGRLLVELLPARVTLVLIAIVPVPAILKLILVPFFIIVSPRVSLVPIEVRICRHGRVIFVILVLPLTLMAEVFFRIVS